MKQGIVFKIGTTDFDEAIRLCESAFDDCSLYKDEWEEVKNSRDFVKLAEFLSIHDIDNELFNLSGYK